MKKIKFIIVLFFIINTIFGQIDAKYSDDLLTTSFKTYKDADFEMSYHIFPFLKKRFLEHIKDTSSFHNPYNSLSKYIKIKKSSDNLMKIYSWHERDTGCCAFYQNHIQYQTKSGEIKNYDLSEIEIGKESIAITDLQRITINEKPYYLLLGWGTCCGGKHYSEARIYEIKNGLLQSITHFNGKKTLYIGANRGSRIDLTYDTGSKILSYNYYGTLNDNGFYNTKKNFTKWKLTSNGFKKIN